jgi:hypothetical protein
MITHAELVEARDTLLERTVAFFTKQPDVIGIFLGGSMPAGSADAYSDIDLRIIATPEGQARLVAGRLEWPLLWGDLLFNEWLNGTQHCVSHFRPFLKIDVMYWTPNIFKPSPWFRMPARVFLDREGLIASVLAQSAALRFGPPAAPEVSRVLSKALAGLHSMTGLWRWAWSSSGRFRICIGNSNGLARLMPICSPSAWLPSDRSPDSRHTRRPPVRS